MGTSAIVLMIVSMLIIWGGLALAILNLNRKGTETGPTHDPEYPEHRDL